MKDYYKILGLEEGASLEEITARWLEIKKQYQFTPEKNNDTDHRIREINEAYRILKASVPPAYKFDLENYLKKRGHKRKAQVNAEKKKMIVVSSSVLAIGLITGALLFFIYRAPDVQRSSKAQTEPNRITRESIEVAAALPLLESKSPVTIPAITPQEPNKTSISEGAPSGPISKESASPALKDSAKAAKEKRNQRHRPR